MAALPCFPQIILSSILFINLCLQIHLTSAQLLVHDCNNGIGNYTEKNSKFQLNLNNILSSIASQIINPYGFFNPYGFYNGTEGNGIDQVNAIALCRGDIDIEQCQGCVKDAANNLTQLCPNQKEAIIWLDECMLRYSNKSILGIMSTSPGYILMSLQNASNVDLFTRELRSFAGSFVDQAYDGYFRKLTSIDPNAPTVYGLMQCTPDITPIDCMSCLDFVSSYLSSCCYNRVGARFLSPSCTFHYEIYSFLNLSNEMPLPSAPPSTQPLLVSPSSSSSPSLPPSSITPSTTSSPSLPPPLSSTPSTPTTKGKRSKLKAIIIVAVCVILVLLVSTLSAYVFITKRRSQNTSTGKKLTEELEAIGDKETRQYDFSLIRSATNDFSTANFLGKGGFGKVYKGVLFNEKKIAVKRLSKTSSQGENEFINEVKLLAKLQHKCLVRLMGFCLEKKEKLLIYEFMENGSLDNILFGIETDEINRSKLDWEVRYNIINNVAKGLVYLHEDSRLMVIHRDLKASNILLDEKMNAKISDFGTARQFALDESEANTTRIAGTMGYMAPEYAMHGMFSVKSDVYSYGVLLLEIISGKKNYYTITEDSEEGLLSYAYKTWRGGRVFDLIDTKLTAHSHSLEFIIRCVHIALLCVQENVGSRPTMAKVILMLQNLTTPLPLPSEPGFYGSTRSWLSKNQTSTSNPSKSPVLVHDTNINDSTFSDETNSYLYPR